MSDDIYPKWKFEIDIRICDARIREARSAVANGKLDGLELLALEREVEETKRVLKRAYGENGRVFGGLRAAKAALERAGADGETVEAQQKRVNYLKFLAAKILDKQPKREVVPTEIERAEVANTEVRQNPLGYYESLQAGRWLPVTLEWVKAQPIVYYRDYGGTL